MEGQCSEIILKTTESNKTWLTKKNGERAAPDNLFVFILNFKSKATMEYYSAFKNNDVMNFSGKWMVLEKIIQREITQTRKDKADLGLRISGY